MTPAAGADMVLIEGAAFEQTIPADDPPRDDYAIITPVHVERVPATITFPLRQAVLRPHQTVASLAQPGDDDEDTGNFAALAGGEVISTASVRRETPPWAQLSPTEDPPAWWRLRGMATADGFRGQGIGAAVLAAVIDHVADHGGGVLWCHARTPAAAFYERAGFATRGEAWDEPLIGPHVVMVKPSS